MAGEWSGASQADDEAETGPARPISRGKKERRAWQDERPDSAGAEFAVSYRAVRRDANPPRDRRTKTRPARRTVPNLSLLRGPFRFSLYRHSGFTFGSGHDFHRRACKNRPRQPAADQRRTAEIDAPRLANGLEDRTIDAPPKPPPDLCRSASPSSSSSSSRWRSTWRGTVEFRIRIGTRAIRKAAAFRGGRGLSFRRINPLDRNIYGIDSEKGGIAVREKSSSHRSPFAPVSGVDCDAIEFFHLVACALQPIVKSCKSNERGKKIILSRGGRRAEIRAR